MSTTTKTVNEAKGKDHYLVANRSIGIWTMGLSIAATWIWAPALFVAAQQAYVNGFWGLFWFTVPNVFALVFFGGYALSLRRRIPQGYTLSHYMRERYSPRTQRVYHAQLLIQDVCSFAVQLVAGGAIIAGITGWSYAVIVFTMAAATLAYTMFGGLRASIFTDHIQMVIIAAVIIGISIPIVLKAGWNDIVAGFAGTSNVNPWMLILTFGIPTTIILLSGPFGFSGFWQRGLAVNNDEAVKKSYRRAAAIFAIVPIGLGMVGFAAAGVNLAVDDVQLTNLTAVQAFLPEWVVIPFTIAIMLGLMSTLDSCLSGSSSIWGHDFAKDGYSMRMARIGIAFTAIVATGIAFIPGITILYLFFFYGTSRAATMMPTILTLSDKPMSARITEGGMFYGVLLSLLFGAPVMIYGQITKMWAVSLTGSLLAVGLSAAIVALSAARNKG